MKWPIASHRRDPSSSLDDLLTPRYSSISSLPVNTSLAPTPSFEMAQNPQYHVASEASGAFASRLPPRQHLYTADDGLARRRPNQQEQVSTAQGEITLKHGGITPSQRESYPSLVSIGSQFDRQTRFRLSPSSSRALDDLSSPFATSPQTARVRSDFQAITSPNLSTCSSTRLLNEDSLYENVPGNYQCQDEISDRDMFQLRAGYPNTSMSYLREGPWTSLEPSRSPYPAPALPNDPSHCLLGPSTPQTLNPYQTSDANRLPSRCIPSCSLPLGNPTSSTMDSHHSFLETWPSQERCQVSSNTSQSSRHSRLPPRLRNTPNPLRCAREGCSSSYAGDDRITNLKRHTKEKHGNQAPISCLKCGNTYKRQWNLKRHQRHDCQGQP